MHDAFVAVDTATDLPARALALRRSWESAQAGEEIAGVRSLVRLSWQRAASSGLTPDGLSPIVGCQPEELDHRRAMSSMSRCIDALRQCLAPFALDAEHFMTVLDDTGLVLWQEGAPRLLDKANAVRFREGMLWTEKSVGTNAGGTALAIDHAVQIYAAEHFVADHHAWWCSAAPVHDPVSGAVVGVVGLSGPSRTAHPHSLQLVCAAARMAEVVLRSRVELATERLLRKYAERTAGARESALGLVAAGGRVLHQRADARLPDRLPGPSTDGSFDLPNGRALAEPLDGGDGWVLWDTPSAHATARAAVLHLELLGATATLRIAGRDPVELRTRHAEILAILALHPSGLTVGELASHLFAEPKGTVTTRAEVSRLRKLVGPLLSHSPYRLRASVSVDAFEVERALTRGDLDTALFLHRAPLLQTSAAPRVEQWRDELEGSLRQAVLLGTADQLSAWTSSVIGRDDVEALEVLIALLRVGDPRRPTVATRLQGLRHRLRRTMRVLD